MEFPLRTPPPDPFRAPGAHPRAPRKAQWAGRGLLFLALWPYWLLLTWPRRRRMRKRCLRDRFWEPFWLPQTKIFGLLFLASHASVSATIFQLFPARRCSTLLGLRGVRDKRAHALRPTKTKVFSMIFDVCFSARGVRR